GEIRIGGAPVQGYGMDRGVVFQDFAQLFPWRTALGNVAFGLEMKGLPKAERNAIALEQLRLVKLENFARSYPHHLSGGMQQRVAKPGRSLTIPRCCSWTSRSRRSTRSRAMTCSGCSRRCGARRARRLST